jgi:homoserine O-acetyltransferase
MADLGVDVTYAELDSPHGHDAFLKDWDALAAIIEPFLDRAATAASAAFG